VKPVCQAEIDNVVSTTDLRLTNGQNATVFERLAGRPSQNATWLPFSVLQPGSTSTQSCWRPSEQCNAQAVRRRSVEGEHCGKAQRHGRCR